MFDYDLLLDFVQNVHRLNGNIQIGPNPIKWRQQIAITCETKYKLIYNNNISQTQILFHIHFGDWVFNGRMSYVITSLYSQQSKYNT